MKFSGLRYFLLAVGVASTSGQALNQPCTVVKVELLNLRGNDEPLDEYHCELNSQDSRGVSGTMARLSLNDEQTKEMNKEMNDGTLISGVSTYHNAGASLSSKGEILVPSSDRMDPSSFTTGWDRRLNRELVQEGDKTYLVVRIQATDYEFEYSADDISKDVFGGVGDLVNLKSQMYDCSGEKLNIVNTYADDFGDLMAAPGVIDVSIDIPLTGSSDSAIWNAAKNAANAKLGVSINTYFDKVMFAKKGCFPNNCSYAAYAYINSWGSMYQSGYIKHVGVQMHELGHNFGLAHSGMGSKSYKDHTGLMGNPLYDDEVGKMCFNPAKSFQLGWYPENVQTLDLGVGDMWQGQLVGVADYLNNPDNNKIVMKLETGTNEDYFVGFNRATGINSQNDLCDDCVTVIKAGNGNSYAQSWNQIDPLGGMSSAGQEHTISGFRNTSYDLTIQVLDINTTTSPGTATVKISFGDASICKDWCYTITIPFQSPSGGIQKCDFVGLCDACNECSN